MADTRVALDLKGSKVGASQIRQRLNDLHTYLLLSLGLKGWDDPRFKELKVFLGDLGEFVKAATSAELKTRGRAAEDKLAQVLELLAKMLPRRASVSTIAMEFRDLARDYDVWRYGLTYGWVSERFVREALPHPLDLPPHARIGIGGHTGNASVEELFLLEDAFLLFARAEDMWRKLVRASHVTKADDVPDQHARYRSLTLMNSEIGTYCRLSVVTSAAFVEAFVNSVGWREATRTNLSAEAVASLKGRRKDRYHSLEWKLENFPKLIREDGRSPIVVTDDAQLKEPFKTFLNTTKEVRDSSMHYAPGKASIWRPPPEWLDAAKSATKSAVEVSQTFWLACYPARALPEYLDKLEYANFLSRAQNYVQQALTCDGYAAPAPQSD